ncbi:hypothetical protein Tco_0670065 [Tanacetum coccineum]
MHNNILAAGVNDRTLTMLGQERYSQLDDQRFYAVLEADECHPCSSKQLLQQIENVFEHDSQRTKNHFQSVKRKAIFLTFNWNSAERLLQEMENSMAVVLLSEEFKGLLTLVKAIRKNRHLSYHRGIFDILKLSLTLLSSTKNLKDPNTNISFPSQNSASIPRQQRQRGRTNQITPQSELLLKKKHVAPEHKLRGQRNAKEFGTPCNVFSQKTLQLPTNQHPSRTSFKLLGTRLKIPHKDLGYYALTAKGYAALCNKNAEEAKAGLRLRVYTRKRMLYVQTAEQGVPLHTRVGRWER